MASPIAIPSSRTVAASASPSASTLHDHILNLRRRESAVFDIRQPKILQAVEQEGLRLLILENISQEAVSAFRAQGFHVDHSTKAMSEDELVDKIGTYHAIGIRSKTKITARVIRAASKVCIYHFTCSWPYSVA